MQVPGLRARGGERLLHRLIDDLQIEGRVEPAGEGGVVIQFDGVLMTETQPEPLAQEWGEVAAELRVRPADPEVVARPPGEEPLAADADVVGAFDGVPTPSKAPNRKKSRSFRSGAPSGLQRYWSKL